MASFCNFVFFTSLCLISMAHFSESAFRFRVGGPRGWIAPTGNETETYNQWASRNRFHVGDSLYFKYNNDSVLVVEEDDYESCNTSNPMSEFSDGNTLFKFDRYGVFYFISGVPGHCQSGQKLIVWVMGHSIAEVPTPAPGPWSGGSSDQGGRGDQGGQGGQGGQGSQGGQGGQGSDSGPSISGAKITLPLVAATTGGIVVILLFA